MTDKHLEFNDLDALIARELSRLPAFEPQRDFSRRVMAQVRLPEPKSVILLRRAGAWALQPHRALALAGAYAACAVVALGFAVPWVFQHSASLSYGAGVTADKALAAAREFGMALAGWVWTSRSWAAVRSIPVLREHLLPLLALLSAGYAGAGVALHRLMKTPEVKRVPLAH